jgi:uncharacterized repeat protein (TIGR01451 family)
MKSAKKILTALLMASAMLFAGAQEAAADQYGEIEVTKRISLDKQVLNPDSNQWVENLFVTDHLFKSGDEVQFRITITNTSNVTIDRVEVQDFLPSFLQFDSGSQGFAITNMAPGQSYTTDPVIKARVKSEDQLVAGTFCENNIARAYFENQTYEDTAQVCYQKGEVKGEVITKGGLGFKQLPPTGPELSVLALSGSAIMALAGGALIKKKK